MRQRNSSYLRIPNSLFHVIRKQAFAFFLIVVAAAVVVVVADVVVVAAAADVVAEGANCEKYIRRRCHNHNQSRKQPKNPED